MEEKGCATCGIELDEETSCNCEKDKCKHCCDCQTNCKCGCKNSLMEA